MICKRCNTYWEIEQEFQYPDICPFCGRSISKKSDDAYDILYRIIQRNDINDIDTINQEIYLKMSEFPRERRILQYAIREGILPFYEKICNCQKEGKNYYLYKAKQYLREDLGLSSENAARIFDMLNFSFGFEIKAIEKNYEDKDSTYKDLGCLAEKRGELDKAFKLYKVSADAGNIIGIRILRRFIKEFPAYKISDVEKYNYNCRLSKICDHESEYELGVSYAYGIGCEVNMDEAMSYFSKAQKKIVSAAVEIAIRNLFEKCNSRDVDKDERAILVLKCAAKKKNGLAKYIEENYNYYLESFLEDGVDEEDLSELALGIAYFYEDRKEIVKADYWFKEAIEEGNEDATIAYGRFLYHSPDLENQRRGLEILEDSYDDEDMLIVAEAYIEGKGKERDIQRGYKLLRDVKNIKDSFYLGELYYEGIDENLNIDLAIKNLEGFIKKEKLSFSSKYKKAVSILVECYFEKLILQSDIRSLEKLEKIAIYYEHKRAQKLLYYYYSSPANFYRDEIAAEYYDSLYEENYHEYSKIEENEEWENSKLAAIVSHKLGAYSFVRYAMREYLFHIEDQNSAIGLIVTDALSKGKRFGKYQLLRIKIYLREYLDMHLPDENYLIAIKNLFDKLCDDSIWEIPILFPYLEKAEKYGQDVEKLKFVIFGKLWVYCFEKNDYRNAIKFMKKAVSKGVKFDYSFIGLVYFNGKDFDIGTDYTKAFFWLNHFYSNYCLDKESYSSSNIANVEAALGNCYFSGLGVQCNMDKADFFWNLFMKHVSFEQAQVLYEVACIYLNEDLDKGWKGNYEKGLYGIKKAARYNCEDAKKWIHDNIKEEGGVSQSNSFETISIIDQKKQAKEVADIWQQFFKNLDVKQQRLLNKIISLQESQTYLRTIALELHKLPEVILDEINEVALSFVGDNILYLENNTPKIYDEYKIEIETIIQERNKK